MSDANAEDPEALFCEIVRMTGQLGAMGYRISIIENESGTRMIAAPNDERFAQLEVGYENNPIDSLSMLLVAASGHFEVVEEDA